MIAEINPEIGPHWQELLAELTHLQKRHTDCLEALILRKYEKSGTIGRQIEAMVKRIWKKYKFEAQKLELEINYNAVITKYL